MSAKNHGSTRDPTHAGTPTRPVHHARRASGARSAAPRAWLSEGHGFNSRIPDVTAKSGIGVEHFHYESVSVEGARMARSSGGDSAAPGNPLHSRSSPEPMQDGTLLWLSELPESLQPLELARLFPRIMNKLRGLWAKPALCNRYLTNLLMDSRDGVREGFPMRVAAELAALIDSEVTPVKEQPWGQVKGAR